MELNKNNDVQTVDLNSDPQEGMKWQRNMCSKCKYNNGRTCEFYKRDRLDVPVDIYNCPSFEEKQNEEQQAMEIMGVK